MGRLLMNLKNRRKKKGTSNSRVKLVFLAEDWGQGYLIEREIIFCWSHESSHIKMAEIF